MQHASGTLPLGQVLIERGLLTQAQVDEAMERQAKLGLRLGEILVELGYVKASVLADVLAEVLEIPRADWNEADPPLELVASLPERWRSTRPHTHRALDDALEQGEIFLAMLAEMRGRDSETR